MNNSSIPTLRTSATDSVAGITRAIDATTLRVEHTGAALSDTLPALESARTSVETTTTSIAALLPVIGISRLSDSANSIRAEARSPILLQFYDPMEKILCVGAVKFLILPVSTGRHESQASTCPPQAEWAHDTATQRHSPCHGALASRHREFTR